MRVLAIRGRNLASLAGDFAVDFEAEPLADAGIFAITGPTGAGKSTLLDAMCLALFDVVPRLGAASRTKVENAQGDDLSGADPRAILRHGEGEGFAEIDFVGRDSLRYRARWQVQRARQKADGKMQASRHSLHRLDNDEQIGGTKTETLAAIHERVGLSAEQFRRAVLLAQGDFEAFIRADENERAALLEKLTGSQIYTSLGKAAYTKANELRAKQQGLSDRIAAQNGLDDEARAAAETVRDTAQEGARTATLLLSGLEAGARWEKDRAALTERIAQCEADAVRTASTVEEAAPRREALRRSKIAHGFAAEWTALGEARQAAEIARADAAERETTLAAAADTIVSAEALDREAREAVMAETARAEKLAPELERARMLDRQIGEAEAALASLSQTRSERADRLERSRTSEAEAVALLADMTATRDAHGAWLAEHQALGPLAAREAELAADCEEHRAVADRLDRLAHEEAAARTAQDAAAGALDDATEGASAAEAILAEAREVLSGAEANAPSPAARTAMENHRDGLTALQPLRLDWRNKADRAEEMAGALHRLHGDQTAAEEERKAFLARQAAVAEALPGLRHRLDEAQRAGALAEAVSDEAAARLRAKLIDGEPCPVCGATDHALTAIDELLGRHLEDQRARIATVDREIADQIRDESATAAQVATLTRQMEQREADITRHDAAITVASTARDAAHALLVVKASDAGLDADDDAFESRLAEAWATVEAERLGMESATATLAQARQAESYARNACDAARSARGDAAERQRTIVEQLAGIAASTAHSRDTLDRLGRALDAGFGTAADWRALADPRAWLATQTAAWRTRSAEQAEALVAIPKLEQVLAEARTLAATTRTLVDEVETQAAAHQSSRDAQAAQRATLLDGRPVADVEARLAAALALLREGQATTQDRLAKAREAQAAATAHKQAADRNAAHIQAEHVRRDTDFRARIASLSLAEADVAAAAVQGSAPIDREEQMLAALDTAARDATNALAQRRADLTAHDEQDRPAITGEALAEATAQARADAEAAQARLTEAQFAIRRDDEVRTQTAALRAELERERESSRVWLALAGLIGDAEGRKFRRFAQGLTLDRLLGHANGRLAELKPRYALARGVGADMLIQVIDQDMAGEVRGVHNLSGGERFLISLALALGLAEMSTGRGLRIESLFIDEGFGALDTASLGQAIAVLEHLHASGRRVGVISHVEEVKERIPVKIEVTPVARGRSELSVMAE